MAQSAARGKVSYWSKQQLWTEWWSFWAHKQTIAISNHFQTIYSFRDVQKTLFFHVLVPLQDLQSPPGGNTVEVTERENKSEIFTSDFAIFRIWLLNIEVKQWATSELNFYCNSANHWATMLPIWLPYIYLYHDYNLPSFTTHILWQRAF